MRFRACIENVPTFYRIIQVVEKLQKKCIIKFTPDQMHIVCSSDANEGGIQVWSQIKLPTLFAEYRIQSNADNIITLSLASASLLHALHGISNALAASGSGIGGSAGVGGEEVLMKLAKKNDQALLTFTLTTPTRTGRSQSLTYDVRIEVLRPADIVKLVEPMCPEPDTHILLPSLSTLRSPTDHLRALSSTLIVRANNTNPGQFVLQVASDDGEVSAKVEWLVKSVGVVKEQQDNAEDADEEGQKADKDKLYTVPIAARSFVKFLNCHVVNGVVIACICHHHCLILYVYIGSVADAGGVLTFYIPAMVDDGPI